MDQSKLLNKTHFICGEIILPIATRDFLLHLHDLSISKKSQRIQVSIKSFKGPEGNSGVLIVRLSNCRCVYCLLLFPPVGPWNSSELGFEIDIPSSNEMEPNTKL